MNYTEHRNRALVAAARKYIASCRLQGHTPTLTEVTEAVINSPAPSFYIGFEALYKAVCGAMKNPVKSDSPLTRSQMRVLAVLARVSDLRSREKMSLTDAVTRVMAGQAPCFYISEISARRILSRLIVQKRSYKL